MPILSSERLEWVSPQCIAIIGNQAILRQPLTALFCSNKCPGGVILPAFDRVAQLRDAKRAIISGFHTPIERECLSILLRGSSPLIICPARSLDRFRLPSEWKPALAGGRLLLASPFAEGQTRATTDLALRRNDFVAALAAEILILHATPGGNLASQVQHWRQAGLPVNQFIPRQSTA